MAKQPKELKSPSLKRDSYPPSKRDNTWKKIAFENQKAMAQYMEDPSLSPLFDPSFFSAENAKNTFQQSLKNLSEHSDSLELILEKALEGITKKR